MPDARSRYTQRCSQGALLCDAATRYHQYSSSSTSDDGFLCRRNASMEHAADTAEAAAFDHYFPSSTENSSVAVYLRTDTGIQTGAMGPQSLSRRRNANTAVTDTVACSSILVGLDPDSSRSFQYLPIELSLQLSAANSLVYFRLLTRSANG